MKVVSSISATTILVLLLCLVLSTILVDAEQQYENEENGDENDQIEEEDYDDNYDYDNDDNAYKGFTVCDDTAIRVQDIQLYCDSPGTFYYGSGRYRNSQNCTAGDKGKFLIDFYIKQTDTIQSNGGSAIIDISAVGNIGWYQQNQEIVENTDLCTLSSLKSLSGSVCPAEGKYRIQSNFYWNDADDSVSYNPVFYPTLTVGFKSSIYQNTYDYGGANTQYCSGTTFITSWTNGVKAAYANSISNFFKSFGILLFTIVIMGAFIWFMVNRPMSCVGLDIGSMKLGGSRDKTKKKSTLDESSNEESSYSNSENFDFHKMKSQTGNQNLFDF